MTASTTRRTLLEDIKNASFSHEDADMPATIIFNEIAGDLYPDKSFDNLVEAVRAIDGCKELADAIAEHGIQFKMISEGDSHTASGWVEQKAVGCSTEEWYMETSSPVRKLWQAIAEDEDTAEEVRGVIDTFEMEICNEVFAEAKKRYGSVPSNNGIGLLFYQEACQNAPTAFEVTKDDCGGNFYWGEVDGKLTKLVFISEDESRAEAWFNGLLPTVSFVDGDRLHIEA